MALLRQIRLLPVAVEQGAPFLEAARTLLRAETSAIAVVASDRRVVGMFTDDDLLRGLFPGYLEELRHTAFLVENAGALQGSLEAAAGERVDRYTREAAMVEIDAGVAHVVERFLHTPWGTIAVVERGRFVGMVDQLDFIRALLERLEKAGG
ncbi:MAG TPA: CBS domain-containing protein [Actinomycetota bacterium]|jgi:CBS domain-containing protein|nr:CBS domain-containing protein [Actinomycetota bacterium]